jgi:4-amino-4-deoxy-L-arabinose transferase-like glycosyltransferase
MTDPGAGRAAGRAWLVAGIFLLAAGWIAWLRQPALSTPVWNVDEAITATIADEILAGGVPFRDATDLRAPLTYYFYAAVFAVGGRNNMDAIHVAHTALVAATALFVLLLGRRFGGPHGAMWSVWIYAGLACTLFGPLDNFALNTEWPLAFCSALGAWLYVIGRLRQRAGWFVAAGAAYGLAVLSKQPALLDLGAPLAVQAWLLLRTRGTDARRHWRDTFALLGGFALPLVLTAGYFAARGAFSDFIYYTWIYNTRYYVPEVPLADRWPTVSVPLQLLHGYAPSLLVLLAVSLVLAGARIIKQRNEPTADALADTFAPVWLLGALGATTLSGRGFEHYSIQLLAPAALVAGRLLGLATDWAMIRWRNGGLNRIAAGAVVVALVAIAALQFRHAVAYRSAVKPHVDPAVAMAPLVRELTTREDRIFVWGFYSDFHTLADRLPASRFVHGAFLTGLIPWTNLGKDTSYAVVPGSMETLLADLAKNRPRLIVDASAALNRRFEGYPPEKFPAFLDYLRKHYIEYEPQRSEPRGWFRFYLRRDEVPAASAPNAPAGTGPAGSLVGLTADFSGFAQAAIKGADAAGQLAQLGVRVGPDDFRLARFPPARERLLVVPLPYPTAEVRIVARTTDGRHTRSDPLPRLDQIEIPASLHLESPQGDIRADGLNSIHRPIPVEQEGQKTWLCHAYSALRFPLPGLDGPQLQFGYGLPAAAYEKPDSATDGVEFILQLQPREGAPVILLRRFLNPAENPADRGLQTGTVTLPPLKAGDSLVLITHPGPAYSTAYDWSYWTVPRLTPDAAKPATGR